MSVAARVLSAVGQALLLVLTARLFSLEEMGVWGIVLAASLVVASVADFGNTTRMLRIATEPQGRSYLGLLLAVRALLGVALPICAAAILLVLTGSESLALVAGAAAVFAWGESCGEAATCVWQGHSQAVHILAFSVLRRTVIFFPFVFGFSDATLLSAMLLSGVMGAVGLAVAAWGRTSAPLGFWSAARKNLAFALTQAGSQIGQLDTLVVTAVTGVKTAGLYSLASRLNSPISIMVSSLVQVVVPEIAGQSDEVTRYRVFVRVRRLGWAAALLVAGSSLLAPWATTLIFGDRFAAAAPFVVAIVIGSAFSLVSQLHLSWFFGTATPHWLSSAIVAVAVFGLGSIGLAGLLWDVNGIAAAYIVTQATLTAVVLGYWRRVTRRLR